MEVNIAELRKVAEMLFVHLEKSGHDIVSITQDYYWSIPKECRYDPYLQPSELTLGQLTEDLTELKRIANGETKVISFALVWLSSIIRVVGEEVVS